MSSRSSSSQRPTPHVLDAREGLSVHARRPAVCTAEGVGVGEDVFHATPCHRGSGTAASAPAWPSRRALVGASESFQELPGSRQSPHLGSFERTPNQGSFPPPALPGFTGRMSPSDACRARLPMEPLPGRPDSPTGFPCCESPRAYVLRPLPRRAGRPSLVGASGRPRRPSSIREGTRRSHSAFRGLLRLHSRCGPHACDPPQAGLCPRGFDGSVALAISRVATKAYRHLLGPDFHRLR